jgi:S-adenosylmethionine synthetase
LKPKEEKLAPKKHFFTSESVTEGHPDKIADQISDAVLDACITDDPKSRVACETFVTTGMAFVAGEITTQTYVDIPKIVRSVVKDIGYTDARMGYDYNSIAVMSAIDEQSPDIAMGVDEAEGHEQGAGDQGLMFGFACDETPELMPLPISIAHKLTRQLAVVRKSGDLWFLRPDGKSQVTIEYEEGKPQRVEAVVIAAQHSDDVETKELREEILEKVVKAVIPADLLDKNTKFHINATGRFVLGGPAADTGLTGRKIIADTYGGQGSHGGGSFSGKDPSKVDRSASYMARYIAKNVVASGLARQCELQVAYAIGIAQPVSIFVNTKGTNAVDEDLIEKLILENFDLRPKAIIYYLDLLRPIYRKTAVYGHFGREEEDFTWERTDMAETLAKAGGLKSSPKTK